MSGCVIEQVGARAGLRPMVSVACTTCELGAAGIAVLRRGWRRLFWLVQLRRGDRWDLRIDDERRHAGALVLRFVVACGSGRGADVWGGIGAATVGDVGASAVTVAIRGVDVEEAGGIDNAGDVVGGADAVVGVGDEGVDKAGGVVTCGAVGVGAERAGGVDEASSIAVVGIACVGIDAVGTWGWQGVGVGAGVVAVAAGDGVVVAKTRVLRDAIDVRGLGLSAVGVERVR